MRIEIEFCSTLTLTFAQLSVLGLHLQTKSCKENPDFPTYNFLSSRRRYNLFLFAVVALLVKVCYKTKLRPAWRYHILNWTLSLNANPFLPGRPVQWRGRIQMELWWTGKVPDWEWHHHFWWSPSHCSVVYYWRYLSTGNEIQQMDHIKDQPRPAGTF